LQSNEFFPSQNTPKSTPSWFKGGRFAAGGNGGKGREGLGEGKKAEGKGREGKRGKLGE